MTGVIERAGGTLYCTILFHGPDGRLLGKHRKLMPTAAERLIWGFGDGSTLPVIETELGRLGAVICWENYMPMLRMAMYSKGVTLYCAPTADDRETWLPTMRHIALEGRCFVLSACQFARRQDYPENYPLDASLEADATLMRGGSCIIGPLGKVLAGPVFESEAIITAEIDPGGIARGKFDFDVAGHYARPDIFRLTVNEAVQSPVEYSKRRDDRHQGAAAARHPSGVSHMTGCNAYPGYWLAKAGSGHRAYFGGCPLLRDEPLFPPGASPLLPTRLSAQT